MKLIKKMKHIKSILVLLIILIIFACSKNKTIEKRKVFKYNESSGINTLDPAFARDQAIIWACNQLYNGLVQIDDSMNIKPCIAKNWKISDDGKKYTFYLRNDVCFHKTEFYTFAENRKVVASDFVYSFNRILSPEVASPGKWVFSNIDTLNNKPAFVAINDTTLEIHLKKSFPPFLSILSMQYCSVVPEEVVAKYGKDFRNHPVGTGPFMFKMWKEGVKLVLVKNPIYFEFEDNIRLPFIDAVAISFIVDKQSVFMEFIKGNLDFVSGIDASYKDELLTSSGKLNKKYIGKFNLVTQPYLNTEYLGFLVDENQDNANENPLLKREIRQAINYGFDRVKMIRFLRNNIGTPAISGFVPQGLPSFDSSIVKGYSYNPEKARQLLNKAGYPNGNGMPVITISASASYLDLCQYIQHEVSKIGINLKIEVNPPATQREMISKSKLPFFRGSWIADYPDAENYLSLFYSKNFCPQGPNYTHFSNKEFDNLYEKSQSEHNNAVRIKIYQQMDNILMQEAPVVVLYYDQVLRLVQNNISGLGSNAMNLLTLKRVKKENGAR